VEVLSFDDYHQRAQDDMKKQMAWNKHPEHGLMVLEGG